MTATPLFIFELANNHMGSVDHGLRIIREFGQAAREFSRNHAFRFAFKLQYRELDSFVHPDYRGRTDLKMVKRFMETRLGDADFQALVAEMHANGFTPLCTPFDEASVATIERHSIDWIKIASCSFTDWPLLERIAASAKPVIASTAGAALEDIDRVVSFFSHRQRPISLMHCVGEYPTPHAHYHLNQIDILRQRYPQVPIGYSTHEDPADTIAVQLAVAKGARLFEKHVGVPTAEWPLNAYSASPEQVRAWLSAAAAAFTLCGPEGRRHTAGTAERDSLDGLRRGVFARRPLPAGTALRDEDVFFAFPPQAGQLLANDWSKYARHVTTADVATNGAVLHAQLTTVHLREKVQDAVLKTKALLEAGHVVIPGQSDLEISHHYGMDRFDEFGLVMITVINREYCKKLIVMLPGQTHPEQHHLKKEETFLILHGEIRITLDGQARTCRAGDVVVVGRGVRHEFHTDTGVVFEELSSTHYPDDSYYTDPAIQNNPQRKTLLTYWM
ncbi:N-acetylneuraminate synthase family protein [Thauera sp.]|uniref:N-acetylneuraminate synthase family protein n=1 Tax=Thauera sp. TaxID=1905334 RepID=UPI0039E5D445